MRSDHDNMNIRSSMWFEFHFLAVMSSCFEFNFVQQNFVESNLLNQSDFA